jgi:serine/threonine protein kinase
MAPEQAKGRAVDKRADIWAFGCVVYEMLAGRRAFEGEDISDTLAFVLTKEPAWTALPSNAPAALTRLLRRCLEKDPKRRSRRVVSQTRATARPAAAADRHHNSRRSSAPSQHRQRVQAVTGRSPFLVSEPVAGTGEPPITVIVNWPRLLQK